MIPKLHRSTETANNGRLSTALGRLHMCINPRPGGFYSDGFSLQLSPKGLNWISDDVSLVAIGGMPVDIGHQRPPLGVLVKLAEGDDEEIIVEQRSHKNLAVGPC